MTGGGHGGSDSACAMSGIDSSGVSDGDSVLYAIFLERLLVFKNSIIEASKTRKPANFGYIAKILFARCRINEVDSIWWL